MKPYHSLIVFLSLVLPSLAMSVVNYCDTREAIVGDMSHALAQTIQMRRENCITPDTIRTYRSLLHHDLLREKSTLVYAMAGDGRLATRRMDGCGYKVQGLAGCSRAEVFSMSDQRLPATLLTLAMLWGAASILWFRRRQSAAAPAFSYDAAADRFLDARGMPVRLTPMQHRLLSMLFTTERRELSQQAICEALWPGKPDASDTLYALVRRTKTIIEAHSPLTIVADRGRSYRIEERQ